jgi:hypothetical protein
VVLCLAILIRIWVVQLLILAGRPDSSYFLSVVQASTAIKEAVIVTPCTCLLLDILRNDCQI